MEFNKYSCFVLDVHNKNELLKTTLHLSTVIVARWIPWQLCIGHCKYTVSVVRFDSALQNIPLFGKNNWETELKQCIEQSSKNIQVVQKKECYVKRNNWYSWWSLRSWNHVWGSNPHLPSYNNANFLLIHHGNTSPLVTHQNYKYFPSNSFK